VGKQGVFLQKRDGKEGALSIHTPPAGVLLMAFQPKNACAMCNVDRKCFLKRMVD
jgi:hypothetical protein